MHKFLSWICNSLFGTLLLVVGSPAWSEPIRFDYRVIDERAGSRGVDVKAVGE